MRRAVITGIGIVSCIGNNKAEVTDSLKNGISGITRNESYADIGIRSHVSGSVNIDTESLIDRKILRFMVTNLFNLSCSSSSRYAQPRHHPAGGVLQHVAMQQPVAGIVRDEGYLNCLAAVHQNSVAQWP